ncbi:DUF4065 domain-containing protein [bacterium]|nr:DUF4065 domain-containing protein [bacterium]
MNTTSETIGRRMRKLRERLGMSQHDLATQLALPRPSVSQIENGERKVSVDELVRIGRVLNVSTEVLLGAEPLPEVELGVSKTAETPPRGMRINVPARNVRKFKEVLLYILNRVGSKPNIGETVLYKLLYFIDFDFYERFEEQLTGAAYMKNHYGPSPVQFQEVVKDMMGKHELVEVKSQYFKYPQRKYLPLRPPDLTAFKAHEIAVIDEVLNRLSDMNAQQISEYSHGDVPWLTSQDGKIIDYEKVFYRTVPYTVREYQAVTQADR